MKKEDFMHLMQFPIEWLEWNMYPDELSEKQISMYQLGDENGSEHDRNGAFHWWLKKNPTKKQLEKLVKLTLLDPDKHMGEDVRRYILKSKNCDQEILQMLEFNS